MSYPRGNWLFNAACNAMLTADFDWTTPKRCLAFGAGYTPDPVDQKVADIGLEPIAVSDLLTGLSVSAGWAHADAARFVSPMAFEPVLFVVIVEDTLDIMQAPLIAHISDANELPFMPDGRNRYIMPDALNGRGWIRP